MGNRKVKHLEQEPLDPTFSSTKNNRCYPWGVCSVGTWSLTPWEKKHGNIIQKAGILVLTHLVLSCVILTWPHEVHDLTE